MPYCTYCGSRTEATHRYCSSCGSELSETETGENKVHAAIDRDGFLSDQTVSYIAGIVEGGREIDQNSPSHKQLQSEIRDALADFALLTKADDLRLVRLWMSAIDTTSLEIYKGDMDENQRQDILAAQGIRAILRFYDESMGTEFCAEYDDRISSLSEGDE